MGVIKINNIIYGSNNASDIIYKDITVEEKLDTIPIFDINDNGAVVVESDILTYGHIVDNLNSTESNKILSAKQGKILSEKIDNIDFTPLEMAIGENAVAINNNTDAIEELNESLDNIITTVTQEQWDSMSEEQRNKGFYIVGDGAEFSALDLAYDDSNNGIGKNIQAALSNVNEKCSSVSSFLKGSWCLKNFSEIAQGTDSIISLTVGKTYLIFYSRCAAQPHGVQSGANVLFKTSNTETSTYFWVGVIIPTSTSVKLYGANNRIIAVEIEQFQ